MHGGLENERNEYMKLRIAKKMMTLSARGNARENTYWCALQRLRVHSTRMRINKVPHEKKDNIDAIRIVDKGRRVLAYYTP